MLAYNKKVGAFYEILEKYEAGIVLTGAEVKSVKNGLANLKGGYISIENGEVYLKNVHISAYSHAIQEGYDPVGKRKLLLNAHEIIKLESALSEKGSTIMPLNMHLRFGRIKVEIGVCKSKKLHDRRSDLKTKAQDLEVRRTLKRY